MFFIIAGVWKIQRRKHTINGEANTTYWVTKIIVINKLVFDIPLIQIFFKINKINKIRRK